MAAPPFKVKAVYEYNSEHDDDLKFPLGQVINVTELEGDDWYVGNYTDAAGARQDGLFPSNFVEKYEPDVPTRPVRPSRPKSEIQPASVPVADPEENEAEENVPPVPAATKPQAPPMEIASTPSREAEEMKSPQSATSQRTPFARADPPAAPKPAPAEPAQATATPAKFAPPPVAPKSNAFKDRIAAFNRTEAQPIAPMQPGRKPQGNYEIKKPFVAPPPSRNAYIPPAQKVEPIHKPYIREEDPEIKEKEEEDRTAAEAAGLTADAPAPAAEEGESAPKPLSLKERMAMLQKEQEAQRARHADAAPKREKRAPIKQTSESSERALAPGGDEEDEREPVRSPATERQSLDVARERPRVPSAQRRPQEPMSPVPAPPEHEILSGGEEADQSGAGETTEDDAATIGHGDNDERPEPTPRALAAPAREPDVGDEEDTTEEGDGEEELDEEEQRKQRLRERMARLAGGGGGGPFNPFGAPPSAAAPAKKRSTNERGPVDESESAAQPPRQMIAIPGMGGMPLQRVQSPESDATQRAGRRGEMAARETEADEADEEPAPPPRRSTAEDRGVPPPTPRDRPVPQPPSQERAAPPPMPSESTRPTPRPPPTESRPVPPPPPAAAPRSPGPGSESDDEMSLHAKRSSAETSGLETSLPIRTVAPPVPTSREVPPRPPQSPESKRASYFSEPSSATSDKRSSRIPPPIPAGSPLLSPRPPPPPPPTAAPPGRQNTDLQPPTMGDVERGESDYEGDYDTDIASSAKHKDALKAHAREPSLDDSTTADEGTPVSSPVPAPQQSAPRAVPPLPPQGAPKMRPSMDAPRAPPPVPPPTREATESDYDPYRYTDPNRAVPLVPGAISVPAPPMPHEDPYESADDSSADDVPGGIPIRQSMDRPPPPPPQSAPQERAPPMPPKAAAPQQPPLPARAGVRQSLDVQRTPTIGRRSMEQGRPSGDHLGQIAQDVDLGHGTQWWTASQPLPPVLQNRNGVDLLSESEESQTSKRGGRTTISKDIYVLYMDYSQTIITAQYDSRDAADVSLEQRHEPTPPRLRQDQLEAYWQRFGTKIAEAAGAAGNSKKDSVVGDGSPYGLPLALIKARPEALLPVGTRAYGALVYANLANASTMQFDEIRPGDILTARNARFEGHHGAMRQKYKQDYGPNHVAVVDEWDGTRRSVRGWEQGREKKGGVRSEKFRLGDLRSGEVRVWRVVGREWVGWESG